MKRHGRPHIFVTDKLRSYGAALKDLGLPDDRKTGRWLNNRAENSHQPFRPRHAPLPSDEIAAEVRRRPFLNPQPVQCGARPHQPGQFQSQPHSRSHRVASDLCGLTRGRFGKTDTSSHWSDTTTGGSFRLWLPLRRWPTCRRHSCDVSHAFVEMSVIHSRSRLSFVAKGLNSGDVDCRAV